MDSRRSLPRIHCGAGMAKRAEMTERVAGITSNLILMKITSIKLSIIQDSRGRDTLEAIMLAQNFQSISSVPAGKSKGENEPVSLIPQKAIEIFHHLVEDKIINREFSSQTEFDQFLIDLDGTTRREKLGSNLILVLSQTFARLMARSQGKKLWQYLAHEANIKTGKKNIYLCLNLINGGAHAPCGPQIQEYWIIPQLETIKKSYQAALNFFGKLKNEVKNEFSEELQFGDEGGVIMPSDDPIIPLKIYQKILVQSNWQNQIKFGLDCAATQFYSSVGYQLEKEKNLLASELLEFYSNLIKNYPIMAIEDPFAENDWAGFQEITKQLGNKIWIVGDDLTTTNPIYIQKAIDWQAINAVLIKLTQIGSVSETIKAIKLAKNNGLKIIVSHRSGETMDDFIADLAFGLNVDGLKAGAPGPAVRRVKYERLIKISE